MYIIAIIFVYFVPSIMAYSSHKKDAQAILVLNTFLGWTFIGWVIAAVWASKE